MSRQETTIFFATLAGAGLRYYFCVSIMLVDGYVGVIGGLTILLVGYWLFDNKNWKGTLVFIGVACTILSFLFSLIPTYDAVPSLDGFQAMQIPKIACDIMNSGSNVIVSETSVPMKTICARNAYPVFVGQSITQEKGTTGNITIDLGKGTSVALQPNSTAIITGSGGNYTALFTKGSGMSFTGVTTNTNTLQYTIARAYQTSMKQYVRNNYKWIREAAPQLTELSIRKMRLISLIDREYTNKIQNLRIYMQIINQ